MIPLKEYLTFDDVAIVPGLSTVEPSEVDITGRLSRGVELFIPVASSPMDTVTEWRLAVLLARLGAIGVIHRNMSIESQALQIRMVKSAPQSPWMEVLKASESEPIDSIIFRMEEAGIGASIIFSEGQSSIIVAAPDHEREFWFHKASALLSLTREHKPIPLLDEEGRLRVAAAIGPYDEKRAQMLEKVGVDVIVIDVAHAHNSNVISAVSNIVKNVGVEVVVGNLGTKEGVLDYVTRIDAIAGLRVGIGSGSICSTAEVTGAFAPTLTAVMEARAALEELGAHGKIPIVADGGMRNAGDIAKAIIAGASSVMLGRMFGATEEAPGAKVRIGGKIYKQYRGMASRGSMERRFAEDRYSRPSKGIEEGVEGLVPYRGSAVAVLYEIVSGLKAALGYAGAHSIEDAWKRRLAKISPVAREELKPHDIIL